MANTTGKKFGGRQKGSLNKETAHLKQVIDEVVDWKNLIGKLYELSNGVLVKDENVMQLYLVADLENENFKLR